jgi:hypothetical protein
MRIGTLAIIVVLLAGALALAATNPTKQEYEVFLEAQLLRALDKMDRAQSREGDMVRTLLRSQGHRLIQSVVWSNTERRNYGLFSLLETRALGVKMSFWAVAGRFIPREDRDEIVRNLGRIVVPPVPQSN